MKRVLMLGAGPLQVETIKLLKQKGYYVIAQDYDVEGVGFKEADKCYVVSTNDLEGTYQVALKENIDCVITAISDAPVRTVAFINEKLKKKNELTFEDAQCATIKSMMRKRLEEKGLPIPTYAVIQNEKEYIDFISHSKLNDYILKPSDNAGSRGVVLIHLDDSQQNLIMQYRKTVSYSKNGVVLIEEYLQGHEVSVEALTRNGETQIYNITDKMISELPFFVELGHTEPSELPETMKRKIEEITKNAIQAINIVNGPSHTEIKVTSNGPKIIEIAARLGGDFITSKLVPLSTGANLVKESLEVMLHESTELSQISEENKKGAAIRFLYGVPGCITKLSFEEKLLDCESIVEIRFYKQVGDICSALESSNDRIGHVITIGDSAREAALLADKIKKEIEIEIDNGRVRI